MFANRTNWNLAVNPLSAGLSRKRETGRKILDLTASNPTECGFRQDHRAIMRALCVPAALNYHPDARGFLSARNSVAEYYGVFGQRLDPADLFLTASTSEAYSFIFRTLCNPGDEILIPSPSYPLFDFLAEIQDVKLVRYSLIYDHGWQIDFHSLEKAITSSTRGVIVVHPNNPTGHFVKRDEMARLNRLCAQREIAIIADEVFLDFVLDATQSLSFAGNAEALTFTMSGLSKISGLPQMKAAWLITSGPEPL